ncbi:MAG: DUF86 domain-containing protein [Chloroflexi bacterium]|nr:DUF86 domain-containing protein [Chloroflexota bacterium]
MRDERLYMIHISECIAAIEEYAAPGYDEFVQSTKTQDAIIRRLQIMGESTMRLSDERKAAFPQVNWSRIRGFRNIVVHDYLDIDLDIVWNIIQNYLPPLKAAVETMLQQSDTTGDNTEQ